MSILIKGMEMPINCVSCKVAVTVKDGVLCTPMFRIVKEILSGRQQDCPLIEEPEQKHGKWIYHHGGESEFDLGNFYTCSECDNAVFYKSNYCPNCGSQMESEGE